MPIPNRELSQFASFLQINDLNQNITITTGSTPAWIRFYGSSAARAADTRLNSGGIPPDPGNEFYAELVTVNSPQTIIMSPVPTVQGTSGQSFIRVKNMDTVTRTINMSFTLLILQP